MFLTKRYKHGNLAWFLDFKYVGNKNGIIMGIFIQGLNNGFGFGMLGNYGMFNPFLFNPFGFGCFGNFYGVQRPIFTVQNPMSSIPLTPFVNTPIFTNFNFNIPEFSSISEKKEPQLQIDDNSFRIPDPVTNPTVPRREQRSQTSDNRENFNKMLEFVLQWEGGYSNRKNDRGGKTYKGITQATYDSYRRSKNLKRQEVRKMTDTEMKNIYYERYFKASGADKIKNPKLALYVFDTAVNMGPRRAKEFLDQSGGDLTKYEKLRRDKYKAIVRNNPSQKEFLKGWNNRMDALVAFANDNLSESVDIVA